MTDISVVLFDLDDTLYPQESWLAGAWSAVAAEASASGVDPVALRAALVAVAAEGTDKGRIIDRALDAVGSDVGARSLVAAFRSYRLDRLEPYPGVLTALAQLHTVAGIGVVTDGEVSQQEAKLEALGLGSAFDVVVISDRLGRHHRKPDPAPFLTALQHFGLPAERAVFVGDRPDKDVAGAQAVGIRTIRVATGEYASADDHPAAWMRVASVADAAVAIMALVTAGGESDRRCQPRVAG